jgi:hypothetical protein
MKTINPDEIKLNPEQEDVEAMACSAEFSQGCIESEEQK